MAVIVEAYSVIIRRDAIRRAFNNEEDVLFALGPNNTGCADDHLYRIGFLNSKDAHWYVINILNRNGLIYLQGEEAVDLTIANQTYGLHVYTPWLQVGQLAHDGGEVTAAWLDGTEPGKLIAPPNWSYTQYVSLKHYPGPPAAHWTPRHTDPTQLEGFDPEAGRMMYTTIIYPDPERPPGIPEDILRQLRKSFVEITHRALRIHIHNRSGKPAIHQPEIDRLKPQLEKDLQDVRAYTRNTLATDPYAHFTEGHLLAALDRYPEAEAAHRKAVALAPQWHDAQGELIASLAAQAKIDEAIEVGLRAHRQHPVHPVISTNLALNLHSKGRNDEAIAVLDRAIAAGNQDPIVLDVKRRIQAATKPRAGFISRLLNRLN